MNVLNIILVIMGIFNLFIGVTWTKENVFIERLLIFSLLYIIFEQHSDCLNQVIGE